MDTNILKLPVYIIVSSFLIVGLLTKSPELAKIGAVIYALSTLISLWDAYISSREYKKTPKPLVNPSPKKTNPVDNLVALFEGGIVLTGLFLLASSDLNIVGSIIWFSALISYFLWGIIISFITGIPLKFGYGGWVVKRKSGR